MATAGERAMAAVTQLEKIGFVDFTVDIVKGVYETIVKASMDQLKAYADLVSQVSKDITTYQSDMIGADDSGERKAKVDSYIKDVLSLDPGSATSYSFATEKADELTTHFNGVVIEDTSASPPAQKKISDVLKLNGSGPITLEVNDLKAFVTAKLKASVKNSQDVLKAILKIGMQKVVITNGEIMTRLTFHIDASDHAENNSRKRDMEASSWGVNGGISAVSGPIANIVGSAVGGELSGGYNNRKLNVSVVNERSSAATNVNIDILGQVRIQFRTDTFPSVDA